mmetsp:Transcript_944/g.1427  ORF Transcript_944/g.1427 Transcript_944/m.1427 type:complete len:378 (+) Transcript_944:2-1135(+)
MKQGNDHDPWSSVPTAGGGRVGYRPGEHPNKHYPMMPSPGSGSNRRHSSTPVSSHGNTNNDNMQKHPKSKDGPTSKSVASGGLPPPWQYQTPQRQQHPSPPRFGNSGHSSSPPHHHPSPPHGHGPHGHAQNQPFHPGMGWNNPPRQPPSLQIITPNRMAWNSGSNNTPHDGGNGIPPPPLSGVDDMYCHSANFTEEDLRSDKDDGSGRDKGRGSYKCGKCGVPKKGHVCPYQPRVMRRPDEPPPETRCIGIQVEMDEFLVLRRLNLEIQGYPETYVTDPPNNVGTENSPTTTMRTPPRGEKTPKPHPNHTSSMSRMKDSSTSMSTTDRTDIAVGGPPPPGQTPDQRRDFPIATGHQARPYRGDNPKEHFMDGNLNDL